MPINRKLLRTSTFRLAAAYLMVFIISVGAILAYVYWNTTVLIERQINDTIDAEVQGLAEQYRARGLTGMVQIIKERSAGDTDSVYLFTNNLGRRFAGNLNSLPVNAVGEEGWLEFPYRRPGDKSGKNRIARAYFIQLKDDYHLLVGRDVRERRHLAGIIRNTLFWAIGLALFFGIGGGILISRNFLRRIDSISESSRAIMAGDLSQRMTISGTDDELDRLAASLNEMLDQIERLMIGMREVSGNVAHDLKTPLTRLRAKAEAALRSNKAEEHQAALQETMVEADGLLATFNALLSIARAEAGQTREGFTTVELASWLADIDELYRPVVEETGGVFTFICDDKLTIKADGQLVAQAVTNLIDNTLKYGANVKGVVDVTLSCERVGDMIAISVADHGPGVAGKDRSRISERFVRLDESRSKPGNGLGLSLVNGVMTAHNGKLEFSDNNPGLKATLLFPPH